MFAFKTSTQRVPSLAVIVAATVYVGSVPQSSTIDADSLRVLVLNEELRIGSADEPKLGFNAILAVDVDRDGQMFVFESQAREIRVFGRDGRALRTIGRQGRGPGEFTRVSSMGVLGDTVWTFDEVERQINVFRRSGAVVRSYKTPLIVATALHNGALGRILPQAMRADGRFVSYVDIVVGDVSRMAAAAGATNRVGANDTVRVPRIVYDTSGAVADTVGWEPVPPPDAPVVPLPVTVWPNGERQYGIYVEVNGARYNVPQTPNDRYLRTSLADGSALVTRRRATTAEPSEFALVRFDFAGKQSQRLRFRYRPSRYSGAVLDTFAMREASRKSAEPNSAAFKAIRAKIAFPAFQSPIFTMWPANDGAVWLRREDNAGPRHRWIVVERNGAVRGVVEIPRSSRPLWARGNALIVADADDLGVPWLVRYQVRATP